LAERAGAADHAGERHRVGAVAHQRAVVEDIAGEAARRRPAADLERSGADRGAARIAVAAGQRERARAGLGERAGADDALREGYGIAVGVDRSAEALERHGAA